MISIRDEQDLDKREAKVKTDLKIVVFLEYQNYIVVFSFKILTIFFQLESMIARFDKK